MIKTMNKLDRIEKEILRARGDAVLLEYFDRKLSALLEWVKASREEVRQSDWAKENLAKTNISG